MKARRTTGYRGRPSHRLRNAVLTLFLIGILCFSGLLALVLDGGHDHLDGDPQIMIILGCQVKPWGPSVLLEDRLNEALDYLEEHPEMTVVVSGGQGLDEPMSEAQAMADYLVANGFPAEQILQEDQSHSTFQNLTYSLALLKEKGNPMTQDVIIVSNGFHLTRVRMLWGRVCGTDDRLSTLAAPTSHLPSRLKMYVREPLALVKSFLLDRVG